MFDVGGSEDALFVAEEIADDSSNSANNYFTFPLVLQGLIDKTEVTLNATFDANVIKEFK